MEKINEQENSKPELTSVALAVEELFSGQPNEAEAIIGEIETLKEILSPFHGQEIDGKTFNYIEEIAGKIKLLELKLTVVDTLKRHPSFK